LLRGENRHEEHNEDNNHEHENNSFREEIINNYLSRKERLECLGYSYWILTLLLIISGAIAIILKLYTKSSLSILITACVLLQVPILRYFTCCYGEQYKRNRIVNLPYYNGFLLLCFFAGLILITQFAGGWRTVFAVFCVLLMAVLYSSQYLFIFEANDDCNAFSIILFLFTLGLTPVILWAAEYLEGEYYLYTIAFSLIIPFHANLLERKAESYYLDRVLSIATEICSSSPITVALEIMIGLADWAYWLEFPLCFCIYYCVFTNPNRRKC